MTSLLRATWSSLSSMSLLLVLSALAVFGDAAAAQAPMINSGPTPASSIRCTGQSRTFAITASLTGGSPGPLSFQWERDTGAGFMAMVNGGTISGAMAATVAISSVVEADEGSYRCVVTDVSSGMSTTSGVATLVVDQPVTIAVDPVDALLCQGSSASFSVVATGSGTITYEWRKAAVPLANGPTGNGSTYAGVATPTLTITTLDPADAGMFSCKVTNVCGAGTFTEISDPANLVPDTVNPTITNCPVSTTIGTTGGLCTADFSYTPTATDNCPAMDVVITQDMGPDLLTTGTTTLSVGVTTFAFTATDLAGNASSCMFTVTVADDEPPLITGTMGPLLLFEDSMGAGVHTLDYSGGPISVSASDNCDGDLTGSIVYSNPDATTLAVGTRTVLTFDVMDAGLNPAVQHTVEVYVCSLTPPATVYVDDDWTALADGADPDGLAGGPEGIGCDAFATVKDALAAVADGGMINVAAGTYVEDNSGGHIPVMKNVTLTGAGAGSTVISPSNDTSASGADRGIFTVSPGFDFHVAELTIDGTGRKVWQAIRNTGAGSVTNCAFNDIRFDANGPAYAGTAVAAFGTGPVDVTGCTFTLIGRIGLHYFGAGVAGSVYDSNTHTGKGVGDHIDYAICAGNGADITAIRSTITECRGVASTDGSTSAGILVSNTVTLAGSTALVMNNVITQNSSGVFVGFDTSDDSTATILDNDLSGNDSFAVFQVIGSGGTTNASGNWFGSNDPTMVAGSVGGAVDYTPWLDSGTDTDGVTAGFQGDFSVLHVDDDSPQLDAATRIQEGIDRVTASTVLVQPGTYGPFVLNKKATVQGSGDGTNPTVDSIVDAGGTPNIGADITVGGTSAGDRAVLRGLHFTNGQRGVQFDTTVSFVELDDITCAGNVSAGVEIHNSALVTDLVLTDVDLDGNGVGFRVSTTGRVDTMLVTNGVWSNNVDGGLLAFVSLSASGQEADFTNLTFDGVQVIDNPAKGLYFEKLNDALFTGVLVQNSGTTDFFPTGVDINLKRGDYANVTFQGCTIQDCGNGPTVTGAGLFAKTRNDGGNGPTTFTGISLLGNVVTLCPTGVNIGYEGAQGGSPGIAALLEGNDLRANTIKALSFYGGAAIDAGDCNDTDLTGLGTGSQPFGSSSGLNDLSGYGFDNLEPWSITNFNTDGAVAFGPAPLAQGNIFGAGPGDNIEDLIVDDNDIPLIPVAPGAILAINFLQSGPYDVVFPGNLALNCINDVPANPSGNVAAFFAQGGNANSSPITVSVVETIMGSSCSQTITRDITVADNCGNSATATQTITVVDNIPPVLVLPPNATIECGMDTSPGATGSATATDNCTASPTISSSDVVTNGVCPTVQIITRTWTAVDGCGNGASMAQVITVVDNTPPMLTLPANATVECLGDTSVSALGSANASDVCDLMPSVSHADTMMPGACAQEFVIERVWTAMDTCGNSTSLTQTITVDDSMPPTVVAPGDITIQCDESIDPMMNGALGTASATDVCDPSPGVTYADSMAGACGTTGTITRTWTGTDACGNAASAVQVITVIDNVAPTFTVPDDVTIECDVSPMPANTGMPTMIADNCDPSPLVSSNDSIAAGVCAAEMVITRTWTVTDACGNPTSLAQIITVDDSVAPTFTMTPPDPSIQCPGDLPAPDTGLLTATDNCDPSVAITFDNDDTMAGMPPGSEIHRTYLATDDCGNFVAHVQIFTVADTTLPVITLCPPDRTLAVDGSCMGTMPDLTLEITATDNCSSFANLTLDQTPAAGSMHPVGPVTVTLMVTDEAGNVAMCTAEVTFEDQEDPVILCPMDATVSCLDPKDPYFTGVATATDNCDLPGNIVITYADDRSGLVDCGDKAGVILRTWTATDMNLNFADCVQTITVQDVSPPILADVPADITQGNDLGVCDAVVTYADPTAADKCYLEGFEDPNYEVGNPTNVPSVSWNDFGSAVTRAPSGTNGIASSSGSAHGVIAGGAGVLTSGAFTRLGNYSDEFGTGFRTAVDIYIDLTDPGVVNATPTTGYGFDISTAASGSDGNHQRDFIFHAAAYDQIMNPGVFIGATNNTNFTRRNDLAALTNNVVLTTSGWYTFEWVFRDDGTDVLAVDMSVYDAGGTSLFTETRSNLADVISTEVGGNRYMWVTFVQDILNGLPIDDTCNERDVPVTCSPASGSIFPGAALGQTTAVTCSADDGWGNVGSEMFDVTIEDTEDPAVTCPVDTFVQAGAPNGPGVTGMPMVNDNCDPAPVVTHADVVSAAGPCPDVQTITRTFTVTDAAGNESQCVQIITVEDTTPPVLTLPANRLLSTMNAIECGTTGTDPGATGQATATDNFTASGSIVITFSDVTTIGTCPIDSVITRTWTATDGCGNSASANQTIQVVDTTPPSLSIPADITVSCEDSTAPGNTGAASATDLCDVSPGPSVGFTDNVINGSCPQEMVIERTWTAVDSCLLSTSLTQTITVVDDTAPVISVPGDVTIECDVMPVPANTGGMASATDNCDMAVAITFSDDLVGDCGTTGVLTRTWTATDACGNTASAPQVITIVDTMAPVVTAPADMMVECGASLDPGDLGGPATAVDNCDPALTFNHTDSVPGGCSGTGVIMRTWTATDACGNVGSAVQLITVVDTTPPTLTVPGPVTVECGDSVAPVDTGGPATAIDVCDPSPSVTFADSMTTSGCGMTGVITRTWTATDACMQTVSMTQEITIVDTTPPTIVAPASLTLECGMSTAPANTGMATGSDACGSVTITSDDMTVADCGATVIITRTWTATDDCTLQASDVQVITVIDTTPPVVTAPGPMTVECGDPFDPGATGGPATALDLCEGVLVPTFSDSMTMGCGMTGVITRTWSATDGCTNTGTDTQIITIVDTTPPDLTVPATATVECGQSTDPMDIGGATATDACGSVTVTHDDSFAGGCGNSGVITRTWTAVDACGLMSMGTQIVNVVDTTAPSLSVPALAVVECGDSTDPADTGMATAMDACGSAAVTFADSFAPSCGAAGTITRTWTATDACGLTTSDVQTIDVVDTTAPDLMIPADTSIECGVVPDPMTTGMASATDACDGAPVITYLDTAPGGCSGTGVLMRVWTATDACTNTVSATQMITIMDTAAPVLSVPADVTLECGMATDPGSIGSATATDVCDPMPMVTFLDATVPGCGTTEVITRTWTAMDACGNTTSAAQVITVEDTTAPVVTAPGDMTIECGMSTLPANTGTATATDVCDAAAVIISSDVSVAGCGTTEVITRTWTATDACGNVGMAIQLITVQDTTAPDLTVPADMTIECDQPSGVGATGMAAATDACDPAPIVTSMDMAGAPAGCPEVAVILRQWTATDDCGNTTSGTQTITIVDSMAPVISGCPSDIVVNVGPGQCSDMVSWTPPTVADNCSAMLTSTHLPGETFPAGTTVVTYTATDGCNTVTCSFMVTIAGDWEAIDCYPTGLSPRDVTVVDLGSGPGATSPDGTVANPRLDLATANPNGDSVTILFNDGAGLFGGPGLTLGLADGFVAGDRPVGVEGGNFILGSLGTDLAVLCQGNASLFVLPSVKFFENTGTGFVFAGSVGLAPYLSPVAMAAGDLNQDVNGVTDLAIAFAGNPLVMGSGGNGVLLDALGGAITPLVGPLGRTSQDVAIGDLDSDGRLDVVVVEEAGTAPQLDRVLMFRNNPVGTFTAVAMHLNTGGEPRSVCVGDLDGNGRNDDIAVGTDDPFGGNGELEVFVNQGFGALGAGRFAAAATFLTPIGVRAVACGDLQSDTIKRFAPGQPAFYKAQDVVVANATGSNDLTLFLGFDSNDDDLFDSSTTLCDFDQLPSDVVMADVTNDGLPDLIVTDQSAGSSQVCVLRSRVRARSTPFGIGCPGTNGIPVMTGNNLAVMGQTATIDVVNARGSAGITLAISIGIVELPVTPGCTVYVENPFFTYTGPGGGFTSPAGTYTDFLPIPAAPSIFTGATIILQAAIVDPQGGVLNALSLTNGLRMRLGF